MSAGFCIEIGVVFAPVGDRRHDAHADDFIAESAEVSVALVKRFLLFGSAAYRSDLDTVFAYSGLHSHHDVGESVVVDICSYRPAECSATHGCCNHLYREVGRALERTAAAEVDDVLATLNDAYLKFFPVLTGGN